MKRESFLRSALRAAFAGFIFCLGISSAQAQTNFFTYQGRIADGANQTPSGTYNMQFALFAADTGGAAIQTLPPTDVTVTNGIFTVYLNFTAANAFDGAARYLEISIRKITDPQNPPAFSTLAPRQLLTSSPYSIRAVNSNAADALSGNCVGCVTSANINSVDGVKVTGTVSNAANATAATAAATAINSSNLGGVAAANYLLKNGDGSQLTNLPARLLPWETITGSTQAQTNRGYIANNGAAQVVIALPVSPNVGDVVRIAGAGAGGWRISQNAGQKIAGANFNLPDQWTARENSRRWNSVASSSDGTKLVAAVYDRQIYTSTDSGTTWTVRENNRQWQEVASSADGTKLVAVVQYGQIYTSTDSGETWTPRETNRNWLSVASSSDGTKLVAVVPGGQIYTSTDSGATWTPRETNRNWGSVASSSDGTKLVAIVGGGQIYTSTDSGAMWTPRESDRSWRGVASSADGSKLVALRNGGQIYTSINSGVTWTPREVARDWNDVASSADGVKLVAVVRNNGQIYTSTDSGVTWTAHESGRDWRGVASSADGTKLVAVAYDDQIYTATYGTTTNGALGYMTGGENSTIELQYVGGGKFIVLSSQGTINLF